MEDPNGHDRPLRCTAVVNHVLECPDCLAALLPYLDSIAAMRARHAHLRPSAPRLVKKPARKPPRVRR
jgi:hypothetical protein